jgi:hypothetical protein
VRCNGARDLNQGLAFLIPHVHLQGGKRHGKFFQTNSKGGKPPDKILSLSPLGESVPKFSGACTSAGKAPRKFSGRFPPGGKTQVKNFQPVPLRGMLHENFRDGFHLVENLR